MFKANISCQQLDKEMSALENAKKDLTLVEEEKAKAEIVLLNCRSAIAEATGHRDQVNADRQPLQDLLVQHRQPVRDAKDNLIKIQVAALYIYFNLEIFLTPF